MNWPVVRIASSRPFRREARPVQAASASVNARAAPRCAARLNSNFEFERRRGFDLSARGSGKIVGVRLCGEEPALDCVADRSHRLSEAISSELSEARTRGSPRRLETHIGERRSASSDLTRTFAVMDRVEQSGPGSIGDDEIVAVLDEHREQHFGGCEIDHPTSVCLELVKRDARHRRARILLGL